jgi:hypothetical protein
MRRLSSEVDFLSILNGWFCNLLQALGIVKTASIFCACRTLYLVRCSIVDSQGVRSKRMKSIS